MKRTMLLFLAVTVIWGMNVAGQNQLTGIVNYHDNPELPMLGVDVKLFDMQDNLISSAVTNEYGLFTIENIPDGEYLLKPSTGIEPDGIDLEDAQQILLYMLGQTQLNDIQYKAADVDNSGDVTWYDYFYIVYNYLINGQAFPAGEWKFEEMAVDFTSRDAGDTTNLWATATGEVELDWQTSGRSLTSVSSHSNTYYVDNTKEFDIQISTDYVGMMTGFSFDLSFPAELIKVLDVVGPDDNLNYNIDNDEGIIKLSWLNEENGLNSFVKGDQLVTLTVQLISNNYNEATFTLFPGAMVLDHLGEKVEILDIGLPVLMKNKDVDFEFQANTYPNPVVDKINFSLTLPDANYGSLYIYDLSGRLVNKIENLSLTEGPQVLTVNTQSFIAGNYFYVLELNGGSAYKVKGRFFKSE